MLRARPLHLELKPLLSYQGARYPTADEPLDFDLRDPSLWPFCATVVGVVMAAVGSSGCVATVETSTEPTSEDPAATAQPTRPVVDLPASDNPSGLGRADKPPQLNYENPLTYAKGMFPPDNPWGKGTPGVIPEGVAVKAILGALEARGLKLDTNVSHNQDGVAVELDGLVSKNSGPLVGFEFVNTWWTQGEPVDDYQWPDEWQLDPETNQYVPVVFEDDPTKLSAVEMMKLDSDAEQGKRYVGLVNSMDSRFTFRTDEFDDELWEMFGVENLSQEQAVETLVEAVHDFVDYLQDQGAL